MPTSGGNLVTSDALKKRQLQACDALSHNRNGQKLGRKGRDTRARILAAASALIDDPTARPLTLSAVAKEASVGMSSFYNYFDDFTELLLALLDPLIPAAEESYLKLVSHRWSDDELTERCEEFVAAFLGFWKQHATLLHFRNSFADSNAPEIMRQRLDMTVPTIGLISKQMDGDPTAVGSPKVSMATALYMGMERAFTVATDAALDRAFPTVFAMNVDSLLQSHSRLLELGIRDQRSSS